jgi:hypothetical protein
LLVRHVKRGTDGAARACQRGLLRAALLHLRDAEVQHLGHRLRVLVFAREEDVLGLDVAVDHPLPVGGRDAAQRRNKQSDQLVHREIVTRHAALEGLALQQLHDQEDRVSLALHIVDIDHVGVAHA